MLISVSARSIIIENRTFNVEEQWDAIAVILDDKIDI